MEHCPSRVSSQLILKMNAKIAIFFVLAALGAVQALPANSEIQDLMQWVQEIESRTVGTCLKVLADAKPQLAELDKLMAEASALPASIAAEVAACKTNGGTPDQVAQCEADAKAKGGEDIRAALAKSVKWADDAKPIINSLRTCMLP